MCYYKVRQFLNNVRILNVMQVVNVLDERAEMGKINKNNLLHNFFRVEVNDLYTFIPC